jgi:predicted alpha/beta-fold hydrolase
VTAPGRYDVACTPPRWARGGHAQTILAHVLPSRAARRDLLATARRREVPLPDGDRLVLFELPGTSGVRVHLFHGLSGDAEADYMLCAARALGAAGHELWLVNHRGCGAGRGLAAGPYHSGSTTDMQAVLAASRAAAPDRLHVVVGFSLSGNIALLLAAQRCAPLPDGLIAVSPPVDLARASLAIGRGLSRLYELRFLWRLRRAVRERERAGLVRERIAIPRLATLLEFDDLYTAPRAGFASGADYYRRCSSLPHLAKIAVPAVILTAADDPFVEAGAYASASLPSSLCLHVEPTGGHVGFLARGGLAGSRWLDGALVHYVAELARAARSSVPSALTAAPAEPPTLRRGP